MTDKPVNVIQGDSLRSFDFYDEEGLIVRFTTGRRVEVACPVDEAARRFWDALAEIAEQYGWGLEFKPVEETSHAS